MVVALTGQAPAPATTAAPGSLPVIGRTHAKGFCTTVRDNVAPALLGLMKTDDLIGAGHRAVLKSAHDETAGSKEAFQMDQLYLENVVTAMAHNLGIVNKILSDTTRFPKTPVTDDDKLAALLRAQLQAAADRQNEALNHLDGILETEGMNTMRHDISSAMESATSNVGGPIVSSPAGFFDASTFPGAGPLPLGGAAVVPPSQALGHTIWDHLAADIDVQQTHIARAEQTLSPTVVAAALGCRDETTPAP